MLVTDGAVPTGAGDEAPLPTEIVLPVDGRLPHDRKRAPAAESDVATWQRPYVSDYLPALTTPATRAWFHFCHGHHMEFLYWQATRAVCELAADAAKAGEDAVLDQAVQRACQLIYGSGAMLLYCAAFDPAVYDPCLRSSMAADRSDFSGDMSQDFLAMTVAKADLVDALRARAGAGGHEAVLREAERYWHERHAHVIISLHKGKSLLAETVDRLKAQSETFDYRQYVDSVVHSGQAERDYDRYFGVTRADDLTIDDYWTQAVEKVATVHRHFAASAEDRAHLARGDGVLLAVVSERLGD
ncbi:MAG: hypothetical protein JO265_06210 [Acidimicrobiia bacterium]|nr:hypothetical protein [Acidimicrobiia bacterium]